jgi:predicted CXXCH cytochrome family protein
MKRISTLFILFCALLINQGFSQGIGGTKHDFSAAGWNATGEICVVCHTPHNADISVTEAPLWNREVTASTFTPYGAGSLTLDATIGQPDGVSKLCLSCHDGTVALENFGGGTTGSNFITGVALLGDDLSNDHPVSFTFNTLLASNDGGLFDPASQASGLGSTIDVDMLRGGKVQCVSCHEPHNKYGHKYFLRKDNSLASALCLTCHNK